MLFRSVSDQFNLSGGGPAALANGALSPKVNTGPGSGAGNTIGDIADGTTNTLMLGEAAGRPSRWVLGKLANASNVYRSSWADYQASITVMGWDSTGANPDAGSGSCNAINITNNTDLPDGGNPGDRVRPGAQLYSFHTGGFNSLRCDGSVGFITSSTNAAVLAGLISRNGGEVNTSP